jgi:hypothetical protein
VSAVADRIPLADFGRLGRAAARTRRARLALSTLLLVLGVATFVAALRPRATTIAFLPRGSNGIVVMDVSASISSDTYARIAATVRRLGDSRGRYGLVLFSDTAYQALPPGTAAKELRAFQRFFTLPPAQGPGLQSQPPPSPWAEHFSAGTRISVGLQLALDVIRTERPTHPAVLLVSDLDDDAGDLESLTSVALAYRRLGIPIHVVGLNPAPEDQQYVERLLASPGDLVQAALPGQGNSMTRAPFPTLLVVASVALVIVLAAFLVLTERLRWRTAR